MIGGRRYCVTWREGPARGGEGRVVEDALFGREPPMRLPEGGGEGKGARMRDWEGPAGAMTGGTRGFDDPRER